MFSSPNIGFIIVLKLSKYSYNYLVFWMSLLGSLLWNRKKTISLFPISCHKLQSFFCFPRLLKNYKLTLHILLSLLWNEVTYILIMIFKLNIKGRSLPVVYITMKNKYRSSLYWMLRTNYCCIRQSWSQELINFIKRNKQDFSSMSSLTLCHYIQHIVKNPLTEV